MCCLSEVSRLFSPIDSAISNRLRIEMISNLGNILSRMTQESPLDTVSLITMGGKCKIAGAL